MENEEDLFSLSRKGGASSKLASIFAQEPDYSSGHASLAYKGSKAPPKTGTVPTMAPAAAATATTAAATPAQQGALYAGLVTLLRYDAARVGTVVGSRALALMRHPSGGVLLLCYDASDPTRRDLTLPVDESFTFTPQSPTYGFFYDEARNYWCVQMATADALHELARAIGVAKGAAASLAGSVSIVAQDIIVNAGETRAVSNGDAVKLRYSVYAFTSSTRELGAPLSVVGSEDKPKQVKVGAGKEIAGLEQGLVGMKKGSRRLLVVPGALAYGAGGNASLGVAANAPIALDVELLKVKFADKPQLTLMPGTPVVGAQAASSMTSPVPIPSLGAEVDGEAESRPSSRRNSVLVSRMAAMGGFAMPGVLPAHQTATPQQAQTPTQVQPQAQVNGETADEKVHQQVPQPIAQVASPPPQQQPGLSHTNSQQGSYQPGLQQHVQTPIDMQQQQQQQQQQFGHPQQHPQQLPHQQQQQQQPYNIYAPTTPTHLHPYNSQAAPGQHHTGIAPNHAVPQHMQQQQPPQQQPGYLPYGSVPPQQSPSSHQFGPGGLNPHAVNMPSVGPSFYALESKLDAIQVQLSRCLGTTNNQYDPNPALSGGQMLKALTALISERDDLKTKSDKSGETVTELQAKIGALHDRHESYLAENQKIAESRFQGLADDMRTKNATIADLQEAVRNATHDATTKAAAAADADLRAQRLALELDLARGESRDRKELEKSVAVLQVQLDEARRSHETAGETAKASMAADLLRARHELDEIVAEKTQQATTHADQMREAIEARERVQSRVNQLEIEVETREKQRAQLAGELEAAQATVAQRESELAQLRLKLDHVGTEAETARTELAETIARLESDHASRIASLEEAAAESERLRAEFESNVSSRIVETRRAHEAALVEAAEQAAETARQEAGELLKSRLDDVVQRAKTKIDHLQSEVDQASTDRADLEATIAALTEEKQAIIDQSKAVIGKIRVQVQEQQERHEEAMSQAVAAASAAAVVAAPPTDAVDWREKVKKSMQTLFQTLAASLADTEDESYTRAQIRDLLVKDIKQVTVRILTEETEAADEEEQAEAETEAATEAEPDVVEEADGDATNAAESAPVVESEEQEAEAESEVQPEFHTEPEVEAEPEAEAPTDVIDAADTTEPEVEPAVAEEVADAEPTSQPDESVVDQTPVEAAVDEPQVEEEAAPESESVEEAAVAQVEAVAVIAEEVAAPVVEPESQVEDVPAPEPEPAVEPSPEPVAVVDAPVVAAASATAASSSSKNQKKKNKKKNKKAASKNAASTAAAADEEDEAEPEVEETPTAVEPAAVVTETTEEIAEEVAEDVTEEVAPAVESPAVVDVPAVDVDSDSDVVVVSAPTTAESAPIVVEPESSPISEPVVESTLPEFEPIESRAASDSVVEPSPVSSQTTVAPAKLFDPFGESDETEADVQPVVVPTPAPAQPKPAVSNSLFGDDDDDDLFPPPKPVAAVKKPASKSLFDDDDDF